MRCGVASCARFVLERQRAGEATVVGRATASRRPQAAVRTTTDDQVPSRSSSVSRWRHGIRAWGRGELETTIRPLEPGSAAGASSVKGGPRHPTDHAIAVT